MSFAEDIIDRSRMSIGYIDVRGDVDVYDFDLSLVGLLANFCALIIELELFRA